MYAIKKAIARASLLALGVGFEMVSKRSPELRAELAGWDEGRVFSLGVLPRGPAVALRKEGDRIRYLGSGHHDSTLRILFKNIDCALLPLTGRIGADTAFVQRRGILHGSVVEAMQTSRAMAIVQAYLLPGFMLRKTSKRPPKMTAAQGLLKVWVMASVGFVMLLNVGK